MRTSMHVSSAEKEEMQTVYVTQIFDHDETPQQNNNIRHFKGQHRIEAPMLDSVVIGCGGVGSFALRALSKRAANVLGLEQFAHAHHRGSSHGGSRIYRKAYFEHSNYVPWIQFSEQGFRDLGAYLLENCGTLIIEEHDGPLIPSCQHSAKDHGIDVELLSNGELRERYPQFQLHSNHTVGLLEPGGGFVRPERAMKAALMDAETHGAKIWEYTTVKSLKEYDTHVDIILEREGGEQMVQTKSVIVSAGAWTSALIPSWKAHLTPTRQLQGWMNVESTPDPSLYNPNNMPTWYMSTPGSKLPLYGIPVDPNSEMFPNSIKVGIHLRPQVVTDPTFNPQTTTEIELAELYEASSTALRDDNSLLTFASTMPCLYTMTPDSHFMMGRASKRIVCTAGLSGHGFKMTPALGEFLVDTVLGGNNGGGEHWKADFCSPSRFGSISQ